MPHRPVSVAVVSDVPLVAAGLRSLLQGYADRVEVVDLDTRAACDVLLYDPTGRADADERRLQELVADPRARRVAVYSVGWSSRSMREATRIGVHGFIPKTLPAHDLVDAIVDVAAGRAVAPSRRAGRARRSAATWLGRADGLTERESQVLVLCADGLSNREIAEALYVNVETVKSHLKHAYSRLGLRNRAQAAAYVHRVAPPVPLVPVDWPGQSTSEVSADTDGDAAPGAERDDVAVIDPAELADRLALLGLDAAARAALRPLAPAVEAGADEFVARLTDRWLRHAATQHLVADRASLARLAEHQRLYLSELFAGDLGGAHASAMMHIGATHHRLRIPPQWYLASYAHLVCDHLPLVLHDDGPGVDGLVTLLGSVLFDAALVLDAYELAVSRELRSPEAMPTPMSTSVVQAAPRPVAEGRRRPIAEIVTSGDDVGSRAEFLEIDEATVATLRALAPDVARSMPDVLAAFYGLIEANAQLRPLVAGDVTARLRREVAAFWTETTEARFDRNHAASRQRVGVIHEQIGLSPQHYVAGLAMQLGGLLRAIATTSDDLVRDATALIRAAFLDMTFVVDAYLDARTASLLETGVFASQVMAGMADGVAVVDARDRIEFANEQFLDLVGVDPSVLHRMPVDAALPIPGIRDLIEAARTGGVGRVTAVHGVRARTLRLIAMRLDAAVSARGVMVALVVDDISDVLRAGAQIAREDRRLEHVLDAVDALAWEADADSMLLLAVSRSARHLTGVRDVDLLGRARFVDLVHTDDVREFLVRCGSLQVGERADVEHRMIRPDGGVLRVRSSIVATTGRSGEPTVSGVTIEIPVGDQLDRKRSRPRS